MAPLLTESRSNPSAVENMIALCALLNPSLPDASMLAVSWDIDDGVDDRTAVTALAGSGDEA